MDYLDFAKNAVLNDSRNVFAQYDGNLDFVPETLKGFYKHTNPIAVEMNCVRFIPAEKLSGAQAEYSYLNVQLIFATCNGDPIFWQNGCIYTVPHGIKNPEWELLAKDIETYLSSLFLD